MVLQGIKFIRWVVVMSFKNYVLLVLYFSSIFNIFKFVGKVAWLSYTSGLSQIIGD
jgi:hypothetical protein